MFQSKSERKRQEFANKVAQFGFDNKDSFVIMADVNLNVIVASYKGLVTAFHNKSRTRRIGEAFEVNPSEDFAEEGNLKNLHSRRNVAIRQLLYELDGVINDLGQKWYNLKKGKKELTKAISSGMISIGVKDEKGNVKDVITAAPAR